MQSAFANGAIAIEPFDDNRFDRALVHAPRRVPGDPRTLAASVVGTEAPPPSEALERRFH